LRQGEQASHRLAILGGGNMGEALLEGVLASSWAVAAELAVAETRAERRQFLADRYQVTVTATAREAAELSPTLVLAVKPQDVPSVLAEVAGAIDKTGLLISIAAGIPLSVLERGIGAEVPVVRVMPNTPALIREGVSVLAAGRWADDAHLDLAEEILAAVGEVVRVAEKHLDAVTALSGNGPAYVFLLAEALIDGAVATGLPRDIATALAKKTIAGAGRMLIETAFSPTELRAMVTSPGGTTAAAMRVLEGSGFRSTFYEALAAATERSRVLGREAEDEV
jgi:pyrroline-5-carboxylate reductase